MYLPANQQIFRLSLIVRKMMPRSVCVGLERFEQDCLSRNVRCVFSGDLRLWSRQGMPSRISKEASWLVASKQALDQSARVQNTRTAMFGGMGTGVLMGISGLAGSASRAMGMLLTSSRRSCPGR
jgi:hypothetical protein